MGFDADICVKFDFWGLKMAKKIISIVLLMAFFVMIGGPAGLHTDVTKTAVDFNPVSALNESDKTIRFNSDGKLKILQVADTHLEFDKNFEASIWVVAEACDIEKPDLVVLTGDNVTPSDDPEETKKLIDALMNVFESRNIPVAVTFGNHDSEKGPMTREDIMAYYNILLLNIG